MEEAKEKMIDKLVDVSTATKMDISLVNVVKEIDVGIDMVHYFLQRSL